VMTKTRIFEGRLGHPPSNFTPDRRAINTSDVGGS
jgi:hypothetical protein